MGLILSFLSPPKKSGAWEVIFCAPLRRGARDETVWQDAGASEACLSQRRSFFFWYYGKGRDLEVFGQTSQPPSSREPFLFEWLGVLHLPANMPPWMRLKLGGEALMPISKEEIALGATHPGST